MPSLHDKSSNQRSDNWYRRLIESTSAIPWELDLSTWRFTHIGDQIVDLLGYPLKDWFEKDFWVNHIHPEDKAWAPQFCQDASERNEDHEFEYRFMAADGRVVWLRDVVSVAVDEFGQRKLQGFMFDISERKQVEESLRALAVGSADDASDTFFYDCVHQLAQVYDARYAFIGLLKENRQQVATLAVWAGDSFADNFEYDLEGTPCKDILDLKLELIPTDAAKLYAGDELLVQMDVDSYFGAPLTSTQGEMMGLVSVMDTKAMELSDWTAPILGMFATRIAVELEKRAANQRLRELNASLEQRIQQRTAELEVANQELEHFAYSVSHDLRAPLRSISGFSEALNEDYAQQLDEQAHDYLQRVQSGCQRMNDLIEALLGLSRLTGSKLKPEPTDLSQLAHEAITQLQQQHPQRQVQVDIEPGLHARCDPHLMRAAITNLLENAWKYTARNDIAHISFRHSANGQGFAISDDGVGFDMRYVDKLFKTFQRLHSDKDFEGTGIGLATVARIIHRHGGRVWAEAETDKGATFGFSL
jgi:PAS domain S-box-containing protein